jgi:DNA invertase Pin-like site-specific DNA recombinase
MRAALYVRVSTADQTTLNQELELKEYCERNNIEVFQVYKDEGVSGAKTSRPALDNLLKDMRLRKFDTVIVWKYDRLGRSTLHLTNILSELDNKNIRLIAVTQNIDTSTAMGKFFYTIMSGIAELEREMIRERVNLGLKRAKAQGKKLGRPKGSKDKKVRRKSGYIARYAG